MQGGSAGVGVAVPKKTPPVETVTRVSFIGPPRGWGFVKTLSPYYAPDGKRLGTLPGGTFFTYDGVKPTSKNTVLVSTVKRGAVWEGPYLLDCTDVAGYAGDPDTLDPALVKRLADYFTLHGRIAERRSELEAAALAANPYFEAAKQAQQLYQASIERAAAMEKELNTLKGLRREKMLDALRTLKYDQAALKTQANQASAAYTKWKDAHPPDPAKMAADPQLLALEKELTAAREPVAQLIPVEP